MARHLARRLFRLTGLDRPAGLAGTVAEALQMLAAGPDTPAGGKPRTGEPGLSLAPWSPRRAQWPQRNLKLSDRVRARLALTARRQAGRPGSPDGER